MLVLTRNIGEAIRIGDQTVIRVYGIDGSRVKFALRLPEGVRARREEQPHPAIKATNG